MRRIILRHLTGSQAGKVEVFPAELGTELSIGRDPGATIRLDPRKDVVVSRYHARLVTHQAEVLWVELVDSASRNGTFLNQRWLRGRIALRPGDRIRLGPGGPELEFDVDGEPSAP